MRLTYTDLEIIQSVYKALLNLKGRGLIDQTAKNLNIELNRFLKILKYLNDIGIITNLKIKSRIFTCSLLEKGEINSELLMKKYDLILVKDDLEKATRIELNQMKRIEEENKMLKEKIRKLESEIIRLRLKGSEVISGD